MTKPPDELANALPAFLDVLGYAGLGVLVLADRGEGIERWYVNEPMAAILGYTLADYEGMGALDLMLPEQRAGVVNLSKAFREGRPLPRVLEYTAVHKDGSHIALEITLGHYPIAGGLAYVLLMHDARTLQSSQLSLLEADRIGLVGALSAGFAHEINNPLTSVLLNLRSLRKQLGATATDVAQPQALRCLDDITTGAERIASNVRALQTLATRSETKRVDLAAVVSAALRLAAPSLEPRAHVVRQIFAVCPVIGEEARIGQAVLAMLLFSSSGFDPESTHTDNRIIITVEERGSDVVVEVSDNGRDLSSKEARHAFEPFFRSAARGAGVGVGLGVARSVATTLGGEVSLAQRPEGGAVITMRLPAAT